MREIEVVLDVRPSPDTPELILVKQRLAAAGDHLRLVGEPHEQRVGMGIPRLPSELAELDRSRIKPEPRAEIALDALSEPERFLVLKALSSLPRTDPSLWPPDQARRLDEVSQLYLVRVTPDLRAVIVPRGKGAIRLLDIIREETLKQFETAKQTGSSKG